MYKIISRKYRPQKFSEVIGQGIVVKTLLNSLKLDKIGQAYLFAGPRGVGKTTLARILGKVLNCKNVKDYEPCGECSICHAVQNNASLDYNEIDGASNRGIDQIRDIQSNLQYASPTGNHRIFVIDEVHMLTIEAFNALLKSLEEPPYKVIFILCTTEINKIPLTIRSRCQNFVFKNLTINEISQHLKNICVKEKIVFEEGAFLNIARSGDGSVRDSENLLEQVILYCNGKITLAETNQILGEISLANKITFLNNLYLDKLNDNKFLLSNILQHGIQLENFLFGLLESATHLVFLKHVSFNDHLLSLNEEELTEYKKIINHFSEKQILSLTDIIHEFIKEITNTKYVDAIINYYLVKLHRYKTLITPEAIRDNLLALAKSTEASKGLENRELSKAMVNQTAQEGGGPEPVEKRVEKIVEKRAGEGAVSENSSERNSSKMSSSETNSSKTSNSERNTYQTGPQSSDQSNTSNSSDNKGATELLHIDENIFKDIISRLKDINVLSYRYWVTFKFEGLDKEKKILTLYDLHNHFQEKYNQQRNFLLKVINDHLEKNSYELVNEIHIKENMIQSSVEKIKKHFPEAEV